MRFLGVTVDDPEDNDDELRHAADHHEGGRGHEALQPQAGVRDGAADDARETHRDAVFKPLPAKLVHTHVIERQAQDLGADDQCGAIEEVLRAAVGCFEAAKVVGRSAVHEAPCISPGAFA